MRVLAPVGAIHYIRISGTVSVQEYGAEDEDDAVDDTDLGLRHTLIIWCTDTAALYIEVLMILAMYLFRLEFNLEEMYNKRSADLVYFMLFIMMGCLGLSLVVGTSEIFTIRSKSAWPTHGALELRGWRPSPQPQLLH